MTGLENFLSTDILNPATLPGAVSYALLFALLAIVASSLIRRMARRFMKAERRRLADTSAVLFLSQLGQAIVWIVATVLYFHLVPALRSLGTAVLTSASVASIVLGLAAQNTLGNLISGISLLTYRPLRLGDRVQVDALTGREGGVVESITLGHTVLIGAKQEKIIVPNSVMASSIIVNLGSEGPGKEQHRKSGLKQD
jgi:small conductance mechanosensitive channel